MRLGILGGTFDPPHYGHLRMAEAALAQLKLDRVLFAPVGLQPLKIDQHATPVEQRTRMLELAVADYPHVEISRVDLDRPGPHYSVDLLAIIQQQNPGAALWFIMGEDSLADLLRWRDPARLMTLARLAVLRRPGAAIDWPALETALPDLRSRLDWIDHGEMDISASEIRQRIHSGQSIDQWVPPAVVTYISEQNLYR